MKIFFPSRSKMRSFKSGKNVDYGSSAPSGKRWAKELNIPKKCK